MMRRKEEVGGVSILYVWNNQSRERKTRGGWNWQNPSTKIHSSTLCSFCLFGVFLHIDQTAAQEGLTAAFTLWGTRHLQNKSAHAQDAENTFVGAFLLQSTVLLRKVNEVPAIRVKIFSKILTALGQLCPESLPFLRDLKLELVITAKTYIQHGVFVQFLV